MVILSTQLFGNRNGTEMKETEILALLDKALVNISSRELVATSEMTDLLLDIRLHLMLAEESSDIKAK